MTYQEAKEQAAEELGFTPYIAGWHYREWMATAAQLYGKSKWNEACEAMRELARNAPCKACGCSFNSHREDDNNTFTCPEFYNGQLFGWRDTKFIPDYDYFTNPEFKP